jgi:hypothetical protein
MPNYKIYPVVESILKYFCILYLFRLLGLKAENAYFLPRPGKLG